MEDKNEKLKIEKQCFKKERNKANNKMTALAIPGPKARALFLSRLPQKGTELP